MSLPGGLPLGAITCGASCSLNFSSTDPERWTNIPLLVKIFKLIINELSTVVEANTSRANAADWSQGEYKQCKYFLLFLLLREMASAVLPLERRCIHF